jgi:hypothetical protein
MQRKKLSITKYILETADTLVSKIIICIISTSRKGFVVVTCLHRPRLYLRYTVLRTVQGWRWQDGVVAFWLNG